MGTKFDNNGGGSANWFDVTVEAESDLGPFISLTIENPDGGTVVEAVTDSPDEIEHFFSEVRKAEARYHEMVNRAK